MSERGRSAWIRVVDEADASGELAELYGRVAEPDGSLDNVLKVHSLHPAGLRAHLELYRAVMRGTPTLGKLDRELIAVAVSRANGCHY